MYLTSVLLGIESIEVAVKKGTYTCTRMKYVGSYGQVDTYVFKKVRTEAQAETSELFKQKTRHMRSVPFLVMLER